MLGPKLKNDPTDGAYEQFKDKPDQTCTCHIHEKKPSASLTYITDGGAPVPVKRANANVQLTPIVQPVSFVPYSSQKQPLYTSLEGEDEDVAIDEYVAEDLVEDAKAEAYAYGEEEVAPKKAAPVAPTKKKASGAAIVLAIFSIIELALLVLGKFVDIVGEYAPFIGGKSGYEIVEEFVTGISDVKELLSWDTVIPAALALAAFFLVVTLIASLVRVCRKGAPSAAKAGTVLTFVFGAAALAYQIVKVGEIGDVGYGLYAFVAIALIMMFIALCAKKGNKKFKK